MVTRNVVRSGLTRNVTRGVTESFFSGITPNLHYDFASDKSLTARVGPTLSITRATNGAYRDSNGTIQTASSGEARFDHNASGTSLGLLVEEARTNICKQSEDILTTWTANNANTTAGTVSNQTASPDGSTTADEILDNAATGTGAVYFDQAVTVSTSTAYTFSVFLKADQLGFGYIQAENFTTPATSEAWFNLSTGATGTKDAGFSSSGIEDFGNGWYRCYVVFTTDGTDTTGNIRVGVADSDASVTVDLDGTSSIFVWGAQLEAGAFPTSYIATTTATVTRNVDDVTTSNVSWYNTTEGSFYAKGARINTATGGNQPQLFTISDGLINNRWSGGQFSDTRAVTELRTAAQNLLVISSIWTDTNNHEIAVAAKVNDLQFYADGTASSPDTSLAMPTSPDEFRVGGRHISTGGEWNGHIAEIRYYNTRLTNAQLEDMSNGVFP